MEKMLIATHNPGKLAEFQALLQAVPVELVSLQAYDVSPVEETGLTFVENALIKARHACQQTGLPAIADDSGLAVDYLAGQPGIYSSRFAGKDSSDQDNLIKLLTMMDGVPDLERGARFHCVIVYLASEIDPTPIICQGTWEGVIGTEAVGDQGFGYDPVFKPRGMPCTAAELTPEKKNQLSHRGQALAQLKRWLLP